MQKTCDCRSEVCPCSVEQGPALYQVKRSGKTMNLCRRCTLPGDEEEIILCQNVGPQEQLGYDPLGFMSVAMKLVERTKEGMN